SGVEVVAVAVRDVEEVRLASEALPVEAAVVGEREPGAVEGGAEHGIADDVSADRLDEHPGVTESRDTHAFLLTWTARFYLRAPGRPLRHSGGLSSAGGLSRMATCAGARAARCRGWSPPRRGGRISRHLPARTPAIRDPSDLAAGCSDRLSRTDRGCPPRSATARTAPRRPSPR